MNPVAPVFLAGLLLCACGTSHDEQAGLAPTPEQAASQMDTAFANADATMRELARAAAEAMRKGEFEAAVVSLQSVRQADEINAEQRMALYSSAVTLETRLIHAMENGDKNAERAYQLLKELKRN